MIRKGRFNEPAAEIAQRYAESVSFDWRLYRYDIADRFSGIQRRVFHGFQSDAAEKNSDMAELTRGKTGRLYGNLMSILTTMKSLPTSYNRDLQEDKEGLFDSVDTIQNALEVFATMLPELKINRERMPTIASDPNLLATDLAEYLVKKGTPFREAHAIVGKIVAQSAANGTPLNQLPLAELKKFLPLFDSDVAKIFDVRSALAKRRGIGAPSAENIPVQIARWHSGLGTQK
jgi:argininosuccinate lyase